MDESKHKVAIKTKLPREGKDYLIRVQQYWKIKETRQSAWKIEIVQLEL